MATFADRDTLSGDETIALLWARVRERGDLPGFSKVVNAIISAMHGDDDREFNMTKTVLQDPALTQKVLRLANSAMYSVFGQGINTVSKAVIVLGTETIGHIALGLKLIDGLSRASDSANARGELEKAVLAGYIARQVAHTASMRDTEEAVVCSMLHALGRMMVTFYLPDRWLQAQEYSMENDLDEMEAASAVLGIELDEIGREVATQWSLPSSLVDTLRDVPPTPVGEPLDHRDWLAALSTLSSRCAGALHDNRSSVQAELVQLAGDYSEMLGLEASDVVAAVDTAKQTAAEEDVVVMRLMKRNDLGTDNPEAVPMGKPADAATILTRGVTDLRGAMESANVGQLMSMALETVYQGLGFTRAIIFLRNSDKANYAAHMGFGEGAQELLPRLVFDDAYQPDVFHAALANDKMILVENARDPGFVNKVPRWWKEALPMVRSFMVLPLSINRNPVGFIYGDWGMIKPEARVEQAEIVPLNELRTLVVRAMEQRRLGNAQWRRHPS